MNRIDTLFKEKKGNILSVYFTAGYPMVDSATAILKTLADAGVDMVEIGMPFSDPMADGPVIQHSNETALRNGMSLKLLFNQLKSIRREVSIPLLLMGYLNPVLQYGIENFVRKCKETGIDGVILPDMPPQVYSEEYQTLFDNYNLYNILLISPLSDYDRILAIDKISRGFIYMVSTSSVTGSYANFSDDQLSYFKKVKEMRLRNPALVGFGISSHDAYANVCKYSEGGIIGSAFVKMLGKEGDLSWNVHQFIRDIRG